MIKVGIIDYGAGNIASVKKVVDYVGGAPVVISTPEAILQMDRIILPGVGAAGAALTHLHAHHLIEALTERVRKQARPFLGICLGMQLLSNKLYEFGEYLGFGWIPGEVVHLKHVTDHSIRVPHMGWNEVEFKEDSLPFINSLKKNQPYYFAHSFSFKVTDPTMIVGTVDYGSKTVAAVKSETVFATQFHPEKSHLAGQDLIEAFLHWNP